jgi:YYY domain-containing protein
LLRVTYKIFMRSEKFPWIYDLLLIAVLAAAAFLRLSGADWGELQHQHPDEGFLVSVVANLRAHECTDPAIPIDACPPEQQRWMGIGDYFNTAESTLNPHNRGFGFFVYGTLPLLIVRYTAEITGQTDFGSLKLMARQFSALADLGTIFLLYLIVSRLYNRRTALLAAAFSSFAVMQIQQSHFFTTDLFVNLFAFLAIYFAVEIIMREAKVGNDELRIENQEPETEHEESQISNLQSPITISLSNLARDPFFWLSIGFGFAFGLALASKVNIFPLALLLPGAFTIRLIRDKAERERFLTTDYPGPRGEAGAGWKLVTVYLIVGGIAAFLAFRIFQPYAFNGILPSEQWLANIAEQRVQARGDADLPWNLQWARRSHLYSFTNMTIWGLGLPLGILAWAGFSYMGWRILKGEWQHALLWGWTAFYFIWQSLAFNPTMRYQLPIYPLLAMMAAWGVFQAAGLKLKVGRSEKPATFNLKPFAWILGTGVLLATALWAYAFHTIYIRDETRIAASRWIYQTIPGPINLRYEAGSIVQQPLPAPPDTTVQDGLPYLAPFSVTADVAESDVTIFGPLKEVYLPHVAAPAGSGSQTLTLSVATSPEALPEQILATSSVTMDFSPANDPRGPSVTFSFETDVPLSFEQTYYLKLETTGSSLTLSGAAVANETDYDYGLPFRVDGYDGFAGIFRGDLNFQVYWDDNVDKLARFKETLNLADYIFIPTNHQYAQITRLPERYPLTTVYYRELIGCPPERNIIECYRVAQPGTFDGNLGFDLVAVFESYPSIGPFVINDQAAEEAFTFYDHPKVLIFKKSADYDPEQVASILGAVDLTNVVHLTPREAASYKSMLLSEDRLAQQRAGGTWSNLFDYDWLQNKYPVLGLVIWYAFVFLLGVLTYPIIRLVMPGLGDKGYALSRTLGLVILAYVPWLLGSLGVPHTRLTIGLVFAAIAVAGLGLGWMRRDELREEWKSNRRHFLLIEGVFLSFFLFDLFIRLGNPDLWHPAKGGERPMDFSYFNAVIKSTTFPPYDPWFAGGYINYYYYGFVLVGTPVKLLGIVPSIAYNFILPTLFAIVATSAFSIGWNLVERKERAETGEVETSNRSPFSILYSLPFIAGLAAALLMAVLGNLGTIQMVFQALARLAAPGGNLTDVDFIQRLGYAIKGLYKTIAQGVALPIGRGEWYWNPSRVIPPGPGNEITEFPFFTFLYSDLHAHMIVLALTTFVIAWALATVRARRTSLISLVAGALVIGALYPTNLSDIYTYLPVGLTALVYAIWRASDVPKIEWLPALSPTVKRIILTVMGVALLTMLSFWFYEPYRATYSQAYRQLDPWTASHTPMSSYLTHWGLFLFLIFSWLVWETRQWMAATPVSSLGKLKPFQILIELVLAVFIVILLYLAYRKVWVGWIALPLAAWAGLLMLRPGQQDAKRLVLFWVGTALLITIVVELFTVRGDIGRMNTIFKFYLQAWTLLAVSGGAAFVWLLADLHTWRPRWRNTWQTVLTILFAGAALYTVAATTDKISDRMTPDAPHTLDSMTYMAHSEHWDTSVMDLSQDYRAIRWMQENVEGSPVIVEANCPEYRWCTRITIYTGLPGVVGWNWHQRQQRALGPPTLVFDRVDEIGQFYNTLDIGFAADFITRYNVRYIVVGQLERIYYEEEGLLKFEQYNGTLWQEVYRDVQTVIYKVLP